jgi:hypothetical protein
MQQDSSLQLQLDLSYSGQKTILDINHIPVGFYTPILSCSSLFIRTMALLVISLFNFTCNLEQGFHLLVRPTGFNKTVGTALWYTQFIHFGKMDAAIISGSPLDVIPLLPPQFSHQIIR